MCRLGINIEVDYISFCGSVKLRLIVVYKTDRVVKCLRTSSSLWDTASRCKNINTKHRWNVDWDY